MSQTINIKDYEAKVKRIKVKVQTRVWLLEITAEDPKLCKLTF